MKFLRTLLVLSTLVYSGQGWSCEYKETPEPIEIKVIVG